MLRDRVATIFKFNGAYLPYTAVASAQSDARRYNASRTHVETYENELPFTVSGNYLSALANALIAYYSRLHVNATVKMPAIDWAFTAGKQFTIEGFADSPSICNVAEFDLFSKSQTLKLGVPPRFGVYRRSVQDGGGGGSPPEPPDYTGRGFELKIVKENGTDRLIMVPSTIGEKVPSGMSSTYPYYLGLSAGTVYGTVNISSSGDVASCSVSKTSGDIPTNSPQGGVYHVAIGWVRWNTATGRWDVGNHRYGPLRVNVCGLSVTIG